MKIMKSDKVRDKACDKEGEFLNPPASAKAHTWWHWNNGNVGREGITADLEAFAHAGLGGVQLFYASCTIPDGPVAFNSPEWHDLFRHASRECNRLGLEFCFHNCPGWSSSGGPWIKPEDAMKVLTCAEIRMTGPTSFDGPLPLPFTRLDFYRDVAVVAYPAPAPDLAEAPKPVRATTSSGADGAAVLDGDPETTVVLDHPTPERPSYLELAYAGPVAARTLAFRAPGPFWWPNTARIEASDDGATFREVAAFTFCFGFEERVVTFPRVVAKFFRIAMATVSPNIAQIAFASVKLSDRLGIAELAQKSFVTRDHGDRTPCDEPPGDVAFAPEDVVASASVVDLTSSLHPDGTLRWEAPAGEWIVQRIGYTLTGRRNGPAPVGGVGLECDKLSPMGAQAHWDAWLDGLIASARSDGGRVDGIVIDSYEVGSQNWTAGLEAEFERRHGYAMAPFHPVFAGRVVDSPAVTERFLWDFRRTVADLFAENYAGAMASLARRAGLSLNLEPYGSCPTDNFQYGATADVPMCEFWRGETPSTGGAKFTASVAHVHGKRFVGAEAFTSSAGRVFETPFMLKAQGDAAFAAGVNRLVFHTSVHQPWADPPRYPGVTLGNIGTHFGRQVTWWPQAGAYLDYLARCQHRLQEGVFVADFCLFNGEGAPWRMAPTPVPRGYDFDYCDRTALMRMTVEDGLLALPSGVRYRALVLPELRLMTPRVLRNIRELARAGAVVCGPLPERSPSLERHPACDGEVETLTRELAAMPNVFPSLEAMIAALELAPDFRCDAADVAFIHRRDGDADVYFVASSAAEARTVPCAFRVAGKAPELWHPDTGAVEPVADFQTAGGVTTLPLHFHPSGSVFVVFRKPVDEAARRSGIRPPADAGKRVELDGPWQVAFQAGRGAPDRVVLEKLISWTEHPDFGVRHFSGTATYRKAFQAAGAGAGERGVLDLGEFADVCTVRLNGVEVGVLWKPPYRIDVSAHLRDGENHLELDVTNRWPNRLIGDAQLPEDAVWKGPRLMEMPAWVKEGRPSPTGRIAFATWKLWAADDPLQPSGLFGPVSVCCEKR